jgi:hypothetical protein
VNVEDSSNILNNPVIAIRLSESRQFLGNVINQCLVFSVQKESRATSQGASDYGPSISASRI